MEQTEQINQLGIRSQDRFSKWFLIFKSSSDSPYQNPLNFKNKTNKQKQKVYPFPQEFQQGDGEPVLPEADVFHSGTVSLRPPGLRPKGLVLREKLPFLSSPLSSPMPHHSI